jgi:hypothetical protein
VVVLALDVVWGLWLLVLESVLPLAQGLATVFLPEILAHQW